MKFEVNLEKKYAYTIIGLLILLLGFLVVGAYGTSNPAVFGHSPTEIDWGSVIPSIKTNSLTLGGEARTSWPESGTSCPEGYELFEGPNGANCLLVDDWSDSATFTGKDYSGFTWTANVETRMYAGKRQVKIVSCSGRGSCSTGWVNDVASCKSYIYDVHQLGCLATVENRYKVKVEIGNLYGDVPVSPWVTGMFGPEINPTAVPSGTHLGSCVVRDDPYNRACISSTWPAKCSSDVKSCECYSGYRMIHRLDLFTRTDYRYNHYECIKN